MGRPENPESWLDKAVVITGQVIVDRIVACDRNNERLLGQLQRELELHMQNHCSEEEKTEIQAYRAQRSR